MLVDCMPGTGLPVTMQIKNSFVEFLLQTDDARLTSHKRSFSAHLTKLTSHKRFSIKILLKSIDFESRAGSGEAGDQKNIDFQLKSFWKVSILRAGPGRERTGIKKTSIFN